jgi:hypothetical protein
LDEIAVNTRGLPGQVGYGLIAWLVLNRGWLEWLGLTEEANSRLSPSVAGLHAGAAARAEPTLRLEPHRRSAESPGSK